MITKAGSRPFRAASAPMFAILDVNVATVPTGYQRDCYRIYLECVWPSYSIDDLEHADKNIIPIWATKTTW